MRTEPPPPTKIPRWPSRQGEEGRLVGHAHLRRGGDLEPAADAGALERGDERNLSASDQVEAAIPLSAPAARCARLVPGGGFGEVEAGGEIVAVTMDHPGFGLLGRTEGRLPQLRHDDPVDGVALVGAIEADQRDIALELIGNELFGHGASLAWEGRGGFAAPMIARRGQAAFATESGRFDRKAAGLPAEALAKAGVSPGTPA